MRTYTYICDCKTRSPKVTVRSSAKKKKKSAGKLGAQRLDLDDLENEMCVSTWMPLWGLE